jgi:hypothetical protein
MVLILLENKVYLKYISQHPINNYFLGLLMSNTIYY